MRFSLFLVLCCTQLFSQKPAFDFSDIHPDGIADFRPHGFSAVTGDSTVFVFNPHTSAHEVFGSLYFTVSIAPKRAEIRGFDAIEQELFTFVLSNVVLENLIYDNETGATKRYYRSSENHYLLVSTLAGMHPRFKLVLSNGGSLSVN